MKLIHNEAWNFSKTPVEGGLLLKKNYVDLNFIDLSKTRNIVYIQNYNVCTIVSSSLF